MYNLALEVNPRMEETAARMRNLAHVRLPTNRMSAREELSLMRTVKLPTIIKESASADFDVLLVGGKIEKASFVGGSETLQHAGESLEKTSFEEPLPVNSTAHLLRKGILSCSSYTGCSFVFYPLSVAVDRFGQNTSADMHAPPTTSPAGATTSAPAGAAPSLGVFHVGGSVTPPRAVYSPEPAYTEQARKSKVQGSCTLGLIVEEDGHPSHIRVLKGIGMGLDENAMAAVQKWKFEPAMKDGHPVRTEIAIRVDFHLF
jgi:TonB family protein